MIPDIFLAILTCDHRFRYNKIFQHKIVNIFLPIYLTYVLGKNCLIETVLLSTHNICFGWEIRKLNIRYAHLTKLKSCLSPFDMYNEPSHNHCYNKMEEFISIHRVNS